MKKMICFLLVFVMLFGCDVAEIEEMPEVVEEMPEIHEAPEAEEIPEELPPPEVELPTPPTDFFQVSIWSYNDFLGTIRFSIAGEEWEHGWFSQGYNDNLNSVEYPAGGILLTALPKEGVRFDGWYLNDELLSTENPIINSHFSAFPRLTAKFSIIDTITVTTTERIHDTLSEYTFHRVIREHDELYGFDVTIIIEDEDGNVIQTIPDLWQHHWGVYSDIDFHDFNFDGYSDMRLLQYIYGAGSLPSYEYFWLWDTETSQFVLNEQLMNIQQSSLTANHETRQIEVWIRGIQGSYSEYYELEDGEYILVFSKDITGWLDEDNNWVRQTTLTNHKTGEVTIETEVED